MNVKLSGEAEVQGQTLRYYLLNSGGAHYGILVTGREEGVAVSNITVSKEEICQLLEQMARCRVTPVTVMDVVEDWLCREI